MSDLPILPDFSGEIFGPIILVIFFMAYSFVFLEDKLHFQKSKPVMVAAGLIWITVFYAYMQKDASAQANSLLRHNVLEFAELWLFLLSAMAFVNTMVERNLFETLRGKLVSAGLSYKGIFWVTGLLAFFISPIADNLTTALVMGAVVMSLAKDNKKFAAAASVNIVVAANAGGSFSPFGDITTLMIWQKGAVEFAEFFSLFLPAMVNWFVPALLMSFTLPKGLPQSNAEKPTIKKGGLFVTFLFLCTITGTIVSHQFLHVPAFLGMMLGFGLLSVYGHFLRRNELKSHSLASPFHNHIEEKTPANTRAFEFFDSLRELEWDTLLFFYGIILCVGGIAAFGYLIGASHFLYDDLGATTANILIGVLSAIIDNIPLTFAVLSMNPHMDHGQWLLLTLTTGTGGSLLSVGSAAGVALMGIGRGIYTFAGHLKWIWAVALGYALSILTHFWVNSGTFASPPFASPL